MAHTRYLDDPGVGRHLRQPGRALRAVPGGHGGDGGGTRGRRRGAGAGVPRVGPTAN
jgi:hypothetical protein